MLPSDPRLLALRDSLPGQVLLGTEGARYHLRERVGEGSQGWVFGASWDEPGGYAVVVKVLRPDAVTPEALARFEREAQVLRMLGQAKRPNPYVVRFFDHATAHLAAPFGGDTIALPFTVLEHVRGPTLEEVLARNRGVGLALDRIRRLGRQVVLAVEDMHAHRIVHRDLKPSNVLLATEADRETAKVTDFGLAKLVDLGLGRTIALAGATLGYAPPEQFERGNRRVGPRTDIFSFAAMLYEMLTGVKAFPYGEGENPLIVVTRLLNGPRPRFSNTRGALPHELAMRADLVERLDAIIARATAAEPRERQASIGELWSAVEPLLRAPAERPSPSAGIGAAANGLTTAMEGRTPSPSSPRLGAAMNHAGQGIAATARRSTIRPEAEAECARPASWTWRVRSPSVRAGSVYAALFDASGEMAAAIGTGGPVSWQRSGSSGWTSPPSAPDVDPRRVRGLAWLRPGSLLAFGAGLAVRLVAGAEVERWSVPEQELTFLAAYADEPGTTVTFVGERAARHAGSRGKATTGVIAQFARGKLVLLADVPQCARLRGVARLRSGGIVACGDWGALVRLELGVPEHLGSICGGNLHAVAALASGGALTIGAGGHALYLSPRLDAQLEAVQTTRDLLALAIDSNGVAWAGSAQARLLRRTRGRWVRMSVDLGLSSSIVALWTAPRMVRAICDDGAVVEGFVG